MELFEKLRDTALQENKSGEFPSWLLVEVLRITDNPSRHPDKDHLVQSLITQIGEYDPYAGAGCFGASVGADTIRETIRQIIA